jgi:hypothetical protein
MFLLDRVQRGAGMRIFVSYGYNDRDRWIRDLVFPIIEAFGGTVETGEGLHGEQIPEAVQRKIARSDALMAFATKREQLVSGLWMTHRWVTDELALAIQQKRLCVEVRERDVASQGGVAGGRQFIEYDEQARDKCLVELVKTLGKWHLEAPITVQLRPGAFVDWLRPRLRRPGLHCTYTVLEGSRQSEAVQTEILPIKGGLFIKVEIPRHALLQVHVKVSGEPPWSSDFDTIDSFGIDLKQDEG